MLCRHLSGNVNCDCLSSKRVYCTVVHSIAMLGTGNLRHIRTTYIQRSSVFRVNEQFTDRFCSARLIFLCRQVTSRSDTLLIVLCIPCNIESPDERHVNIKQLNRTELFGYFFLT